VDELPSYFGSFKDPPVPAGDEWVLVLGQLNNQSEDNVTIQKILPQGRGLDDVVTTVAVRIAPIDGIAAHSVPGGVFTTWPPAFPADAGGCAVQLLKSPSDYVLAPHARAWITTWLRAQKAGVFALAAQRVVYSVGSDLFYQDIPDGFRGRVALSGSPVHGTDLGKTCAGKVKNLPTSGSAG
jgi:hypothetical protein